MEQVYDWRYFLQVSEAVILRSSRLKEPYNSICTRTSPFISASYRTQPDSYFPYLNYKVVQIWPGLIVCKEVTVCPGHIWTTLYIGDTRSLSLCCWSLLCFVWLITNALACFALYFVSCHYADGLSKLLVDWTPLRACAVKYTSHRNPGFKTVGNSRDLFKYTVTLRRGKRLPASRRVAAAEATKLKSDQLLWAMR
jgi:hypothetical protein